ncbi:hypothetical protein [Streptomyces sp. 7N604]|uniref:hypothetical protein n=1 Tax=Streptomyces sp. 7N604 TaxID=3457415 RepID=UPI003FCF6BD1
MGLLSDGPFVEVAPGLRLMRLRERFNEPVFAHRPTTRPRRVVVYVRMLSGADPAPVFEVLEQEANRCGWQVGHLFHDETGPLAPQQSPGWLKARKLLHEGFADGVLFQDRSHINRDDAEYQTELTSWPIASASRRWSCPKRRREETPSGGWASGISRPPDRAHRGGNHA